MNYVGVLRIYFSIIKTFINKYKRYEIFQSLIDVKK